MRKRFVALVWVGFCSIVHALCLFGDGGQPIENIFAEGPQFSAHGNGWAWNICWIISHGTNNLKWGSTLRHFPWKPVNATLLYVADSSKNIFWVLPPPNIQPPTAVGRITPSELTKNTVLVMKCPFPFSFGVSLPLYSNWNYHSNLVLTKLMIDHHLYQSNVSTSWFKPPFPIPKLHFPYWFMVDHHIFGQRIQTTYIPFYSHYIPTKLTYSPFIPRSWPLHRLNIR